MAPLFEPVAEETFRNNILIQNVSIIKYPVYENVRNHLVKLTF